MQGLADKEKALEQQKAAWQASQQAKSAPPRTPRGLEKRLKAAKTAHDKAQEQYAAAEKGAALIVKTMERCQILPMHLS